MPEACKGKSPLSTEHIGIALFLVRHFFPGIPVAVVGYSMIRRCLSIVAVDIFATETRPLNAVTHGIISSSANGADAGQQTQRAATTLTAFHAQHGFTEIVRLLLRAGADPDGKPHKSARADWSVPLFAATCYNHTAIVRLLLKAGAHVFAANPAAWEKACVECDGEYVCGPGADPGPGVQ